MSLTSGGNEESRVPRPYAPLDGSWSIGSNPQWRRGGDETTCVSG
jgi:hypothetical protein